MSVNALPDSVGEFTNEMNFVAQATLGVGEADEYTIDMVEDGLGDVHRELEQIFSLSHF